ncbi:hypothetical protein [Fluviicola chungangensis]|uniref:Nucleoside 2-deoxyribosyltransferase n=1 Tax=Fluviicola chungangensis TaxID=2597671 RepID=A0A556N301_9FLAO|nr:hypothetical protein [Fluviicola chungangensis]TSJ46574.1 hypothetical protein FO442_05290 [Fluviicola chungangensis]
MNTMTCLLTGKEVDYQDHENYVSYSLNIADNEVDIFICRKCKKKISIDEKYHHIIEGLIANNKWPERCEIVSESCNLPSKLPNGETIVLPSYLQTADYPKTPKDKIENLFFYLFKHQTYDGEVFRIDTSLSNFLLKNYFQNVQEADFYIRGLEEKELITSNRKNLVYPNRAMNIEITHSGLNKAIELMEEGDKSNKCFIAMSFNPATKDTREAIRKALKDTGYEAIIIDEQTIDSDKTINDEIIASLKRCKFCIADFSFHSNGVYFESGFALGQGKKVIYTCSKEEFGKAHFDIKPLQHIIYESPEQLTKDLINKIEAYIN